MDCQYCNKDISHKRRGSRFCNPTCSQKYRYTGNFTVKRCIVCDVEFTVSLAKRLKDKLICGDRICIGKKRELNNLVTKTCICKNIFSGPTWYMKKKTYCSKSCATKVNMNTESTRDKVFSKLHSVDAKIKQKVALKTDEYRKLRSEIAKRNGQKQSVKELARKTMYKLHEKIHNDPSWLLATSRRAADQVLDPSCNFGMSSRYRGSYSEYKSTGIFMRSSWERYFAGLLDDVNLEWDYEHKTYKYDWTTYTPDFLVGDKVIEIRPKKFVNQRLIKIGRTMKKDKLDYRILTSKRQMSEFVSNIGGL